MMSEHWPRGTLVTRLYEGDSFALSLIRLSGETRAHRSPSARPAFLTVRRLLYSNDSFHSFSSAEFCSAYLTPLQETIPSPIPALVMVMRQDAGNVCRMTYGFELPSGWTGSPKPFLRVLSSPLHGLVENRAVGRIDAARFRGLVLDAEHHEWLVSLLQSNGTVINSISTRMNISRFMFTIKSDLVGQNSMFLTALSLSNQKA